MPIQVQLRRGTTTQWSTANPTLAAGELGVDTTLTKFKVGNGSTAWNSLGYATVTFQGAYSAGTTYYPNDIVTLSGASYIATAQTTGVSPPSANWSLLADKGTDGAVTLATAQTLTNKTITSAKYVVSALGSISGTNTLDLAAATEFTATLTGATTFAFSNAPGAGNAQVVYLRLTNAGSTTITWPANTKFAGGTAPTLTSSGVDLLAVKYDLTTTTYQVFVIGLDVK